MKILHTADLHLKAPNSSSGAGRYPERMEALCNIIEVGKKENIDVLIIAGDLFDSDEDGKLLRSQLRPILSGLPFKIVIIPGNHDEHSFFERDDGKISNFFYGDSCITLSDIHKPYETDEVCIWGFPYEDITEIEILERLNEIKTRLLSDKFNILLYHGDLADYDQHFDRLEFDKDRSRRYMPIKLRNFEDYNFDYILAGHIHKNFEITRIEKKNFLISNSEVETEPKIDSVEKAGIKIKDCFFIYPGSPVSITRKEDSQRKVNIFELGKAPRPYLLETKFFEKKRIDITNKTFSQIEIETTNILTNRHPKAHLELILEGFLNSNILDYDETEFEKKIKTILPEEGITCTSSYIQMTEILESPLYQKFMKKLYSMGKPEHDRKNLHLLVLQAMNGVEL